MTPRLIKQLAVAAALVLLAVSGGWCAGARHVRLDRYSAEHQHLVDTITVVKTQLRVDSVKVVETKIVMDTARSHFAVSDRRIKIVGRDALSIDGLPPATMVPAIAVIPYIEDARAMHLADSLAYASIATQLAHTETDAALEARRADLAEQQVKDLSAPRLGVKTGAVIGGTLVYAATHPQQIVRAVRWIIQIVR